MRARRHATARTVAALMLREMSTRYGRKPGGYLWAVLEPLGAIMLLSVGFSLLLRSPSLGDSFLLFYATGYLPFDMYKSLSTSVARSITFSKPLLFYPSVTWLDTILARFALNTLTLLTVSCILLTGILLGTDTRTVLDMPPIVTAMALGAGLGLGVGALNCFLNGMFPVWEQIWAIVMRPMFLASGVLFLYDDLPSGVQAILWWNPVMHVTGLMRTGFYPMYGADYVSVPFVLAVILGTLVMGLIMLSRYHRQLLNT